MTDTPAGSQSDWRTKSSDRFVLKWIKTQLSAKITPHLISYDRLRPWMITLVSMLIGMTGGLLFALGYGFLAGLIASVSQVLDGVDGQFARITGQSTKWGAFLDSVLDRYTDGSLVIGLVLFNIHLNNFSISTALVLGTFALIGSNLISYSTARAESLGFSFGEKATYAGKGTRTSVIILSGILSPLSGTAPLVGLLYLVIHTNLVIFQRIMLMRKMEELQQ